MASSLAVVPSAARPRWTSVSMAAASSGSSRNSVLRLRSGGLTSKNGFSVVAPIRVSVPSSTAGSSASCCDFENRWISSRNRIVPRPCSPSRCRARSMTSRTSLTPAVTALICSNARFVRAGDRERQRGLAGARRAPEDRAGQAVLLDQLAQRPARTDQVVLADDVVERARPQAGGQRRLGAEVLFGGGAEQVGHPVDATGVGSQAGQHPSVRIPAPVGHVVDQPLAARPTARPTNSLPSGAGSMSADSASNRNQCCT